MLIVCDFDGTITEVDTNSVLARRFAPDRAAAVAGKLASREMTLRAVLDAEISAMTATVEEVVAVARTVPMRPGFQELVDVAGARGDSVVIVSSGFRQVIEPMLDAAGLLGVAPVLANDVSFSPAGGRVEWRELPVCGRCGEACKRHDVAQLRAGLLHDGRAFDRVAFVGDGYSDRCGAESADVVFARASLADYLDGIGARWAPFTTLHDVTSALYGEL